MFLPAVSIVSLQSFLQIEHAQQELWVYRGEFIQDKAPGAPSEVVAEDQNTVYDRDLDDGDWVVADLESNHESAVVSREWEICESPCRI